jgi:phosphate starvation-inducible PhoH-like protein
MTSDEGINEKRPPQPRFWSEGVEIPGESAMSRLSGVNDENLEAIEARYPVNLVVRGCNIQINGPDEEPVKIVKNLIQQLSSVAGKGYDVHAADVRYAMDALAEGHEPKLEALYSDVICTTAKGKPIRAKTVGQSAYIKAIRDNFILFAVGPAGTGKTYLAVCQAVSMLKSGEVGRVVLVRPAVEAGESLGFLPGDLREKVEPYVRPLYDAFYDLLSPERFARYIDKGVIEIAPLAYMRGRTLNESFIILDEAQNTTPEQMKMYLTRLGFGAKAVVTGDETPIDLPHGKMSGLNHVRAILRNIKGIDFFDLTHADIVRHEIVQKVVQAYERYEQQQH